MSARNDGGPAFPVSDQGTHGAAAQSVEPIVWLACSEIVRGVRTKSDSEKGDRWQLFHDALAPYRGAAK